MKIVHSLISWTMKKRIHSMELFMKYPTEVQAELLKNLIHLAKNTSWGKEYGFETIKNINDFKNRVPIRTYEQYFPYIDRVMKGEQQIFWHEDIHWFSKSSGTTNSKSKYIPVSTDSLEECHYKGGKDLISIYLNNHPNTEIFSGKGLVMGGSSFPNPHRPDSWYGDVSAVIMKNLPFWAEYMRVPSMEIALMENWDEKLRSIIDATLNENVTSISGVSTWSLVLLRQILKETGKQHIHEIWPELELFVHGGVSFVPYKEQFDNIIKSPNMNYVETYNASEGFFALQDLTDSDEMLLMLDYGIYYEFIPMDSIHQEQPKTLNLSEVELGNQYALVITTNAGLWRYLIGDTIRFTSLNPFRIKISGRTKNYINAFGEELIIENTDQALQIACEKSACIIKDYTACPIFFAKENNGAHEWLIEFQKAPQDLEFFTYLLDDSLKQLNSDYEAKRFKDIALSLPKVKSIPKGSFYRWLKSKGKLGGQNKVPRLRNDRLLVEEILGMLEGQ